MEQGYRSRLALKDPLLQRHKRARVQGQLVTIEQTFQGGFSLMKQISNWQSLVHPE